MWFLFVVVFASPFHIERIEIIDNFKTEPGCHATAKKIVNHKSFSQFKQKHELACLKIEQLTRGDKKNVRHYGSDER